MKKLLIFCLMLCLMLGGCTVKKDADDAHTGEPSVQLPASYQIALDAAEQKATYYQQRAEDLADEVIAVRTELFADRVEYEARIDALEERLAAVMAQKDPGSSSDTEGAGESEKDPPSTPDTEGDTDAEKDPYEDFQFLVSDGRATLNAYVGKATQVQIPATYGGCPVVAIADRAFENKTRVQSVILPSGIETVGWFAFSGCVALKDVTLPESVRSISYGAFLNCSSSMVIRCAADSYAEQYAQSYGIEVQR